MSDSEIGQLVDLLKKLPAGYLPTPVFFQISRLTVLTAAEMVTVRTSPAGELEVLLTRRPADDPYFANLWHIPGSIYIPGDTMQSRPEAVIETELPRTVVTSEPILINNSILRDYGRGPIMERVYLVHATESADGQFFPVDRLPKDLLNGHDRLIKLVVRYLRDN